MPWKPFERSPASAATCKQPSHAWIASNYGALPPGGFFAPGSAQFTYAAVVEPYTAVTFSYYTATGNPTTGAGFIADIAARRQPCSAASVSG